MNELFVGIDAGGSKTRMAYGFAADETLQIVNGSGLNVQRDGLESTIDQVTEMIRNISAGAFVKIWICAGLAGAGEQEICDQIRDRLGQNLAISTEQLIVTSDAEIAFRAAFGVSEPGILIIAGTGSILFGRNASGSRYRTGGWGSLLGDDGGGYKIGLAGLRAMADHFDGGPATLLGEMFCGSMGICSKMDLLNAAYKKITPPQSLAPLVFEAARRGDQVAARIVKHQILAITARLKWLLDRMQTDGLPVAIAGGLINDDYYRLELGENILRQHPGCTLAAFNSTPERAAWSWAESIAG